MWVISKTRLRQFWEQPNHHNAESPLAAWYEHVNSDDTNWQNWSDLKADYSSADLVGDCVVFNIGGNKYRLIARVRYNSHKVFVLKIMTHKEYDKSKWKDECGCFEEPPHKTTSQQKGK